MMCTGPLPVIQGLANGESPEPITSDPAEEGGAVPACETVVLDPGLACGAPG